MEMRELPLKLMNTYFSCPRQQALDWLAERSIPYYIENTYASPEDRADAYDGAFTAFHIHAHISQGGDRETWLIEVLGWYDCNSQKNLHGPFFSALKETLKSCDMDDFFDEALNYIIENQGVLDR
jgi:hypothetical protein